MTFNQFNPTPQEVEAIKQKNIGLPQLEKTCYKCGHLPCGGCMDWCDVILPDATTYKGNYISAQEDLDDGSQLEDLIFPVLCCDGSCSY